MATSDALNNNELTPPSVYRQSTILEAGIRCSAFSKDGKLQATYFDDVTTLHEGFLRGLKISENEPCLGTVNESTMEYDWITYRKVYDEARKVGSALRSKGCGRQEEGFVGIFSRNRPEWVMTEQACNMFSMIVVPLYDTLGLEAVEHIVNQVGMKSVVCDNYDRASLLLHLKEKLPTLQLIVMIDQPTAEISELASKAGVELIHYPDLLALGENNLRDPEPPTADDLSTICYTSGTTGAPKGVMLTHKNMVADVSACFSYWKVSGITVTNEEHHLSYLPLAHMYERLVQAVIYQTGSRVGFYRGDVKLLLEDVKILRPTIFAAVPRLLNRVYDKVMNEVRKSWLKSFVFNICTNRKNAEILSGVVRNDGIWDRIGFKKIHDMFGGRLRLLVTGSAPLSSDVYNFARTAFGAYFMEGYGQTECTAAATTTFPGDPVLGHVGGPLQCNHIKLVDVPEMEYFAKDDKGEVCIKGPNVMKGYYKAEEKTKEAIDEDGWLHTGDIGEWLPNGGLKIFDRKKHIFKLAQGEYLAPEKLENVYIRSHLVAQVFVDGNSLKSYPVAIAVPDPEVLPGWAKSRGYTEETIEQLCQNPEIKKAIFSSLEAEGKQAGLKGFELIKDIHVHPDLFSVENGLLTPTFKAKRPQLKKFFAEKIDKMYENIN